MKIVHVETLISVGSFASSQEWATLRSTLHAHIRRMVWPPGASEFTIHPQSGKKRGEGNGVGPIKTELMQRLSDDHWRLEEPVEIAVARQAGNVDAVNRTPHGLVAVEWETGNISSSHRSLNKLALGLLKGVIVGGCLIVPSRDFYRYLTDRIGNWDELIPYLDLWKAVPVRNGVMEIVVVEYDSTSTNVPRIPKGTDGRALR